MTTQTLGTLHAGGAANLLCLAAAPAFAVMALLALPGDAHAMLCGSLHDASPLGGMTEMSIADERVSFGAVAAADRGPAVTMEEGTMTMHATGTREEWLAARLALLDAEKEFTRQGDELARRRQALPWVRVEKDYRFETDEGGASLAELFRGRPQMLVYHFMFGPDYTAGCPSCSMIADGFNGFAEHLAQHDVMLWAVSRAPLAKLQAYKRRLGWSFPWASAGPRGDFNFDFNVAFTEEQQRTGDVEYQLPGAAATRWTRRRHRRRFRGSPRPAGWTCRRLHAIARD